jgi:hypothetical protein
MMDDDVVREPSMLLVMVIRNGCSESDIVAPSGMDRLLSQCLLASFALCSFPNRFAGSSRRHSPPVRLASLE